MNNQFDELTKSLAQSVTRRAALKKFGVGLAGMALACFGLAIRAHAAGPTFTTIDYPGAAATLAVDINANGQIVGRFVDGSGIHGWLLSAGTFTTINFPGASVTRPRGINLNGDIVGHYVSQGEQEHGFLLRGGVFTTIDFPDADHTIASGINDNGDIAGYYVDGKDRTHGFVMADRAEGEVANVVIDAGRLDLPGDVIANHRGSAGDRVAVLLQDSQIFWQRCFEWKRHVIFVP